MEPSAAARNFGTALFSLLDEFFENVQGYCLDKGTSLLETLATISPEEASGPVSESGASIAGHVDHVRFYLDVLLKASRTGEYSPVDWEESWVVHEVDAAQWEALQTRLRESYQAFLTLARSVEGWEADYEVSGAMAVLAHTAYHLGAIRMALGMLRKKSIS